MITEPLLPMETPTSWLVLQADQHRFPLEPTAGLIGEQPRLGWLGLARELVHRVVRSFLRPPAPAVAPLLRAVVWVLRYASVHKERELLRWCSVEPSRFLGGSFIEGVS